MAWSRRLYAARSMSVDVPRVMGKPRPRFSGKGKPPYTSPRYKAYEREIRRAAKQQLGMRFASWEDEVRVTVTCFMRYPESGAKYREGDPATVKPDVDNVGKAVLDALNGVAWKDDKQVTHLRVQKLPRYRRESERIEVAIEYWDNLAMRPQKGAADGGQ